MISNSDPFDDTRSFKAWSLEDPFEDSELADLFDRYAEALDAGDDATAESILDQYPEIGDEFRVPLKGLYLLGKAAQVPEFSLNIKANESTPTQLGDFEIQHELGRGGMGIVYAAKQISLQRHVALKVLPFTAVLDPRHVARFRNEAQAAASLHHPHIVPVYGVGCERGVHYYSMQLIEGQTLAEYVNLLKDSGAHNIEEKTKVDANAETANRFTTIASINSKTYVRRIIEMGARVAEAIHFAHENGIVHRDIKPSNLLLDQTGKVWVADFGLARGRDSATNLTSQGDRIGTLRYMSPEQAAGRHNQVDYRTDIFSLGITLCELLTLTPAYDATDRPNLIEAIEASNPIALRCKNPSVSVDLETVLNKAIEKSPSDRYASAREFSEDLLRCFEGKPIKAKRKTLIDRCANSLSKHRWLAAGVALALIAMTITAMVIASIFYNQQKREQIAAQNARFYLQQAHESVDRFGIMLTDELLEIPGTNDLRAKLLGEAIGYYDDFLKFAEQAPDLEFEQAKAHSQLAGLYERVGNDDKALDLYKVSIQLLSNLASEPETKLAKAVCLNRIGLLHKRRGEFSECSTALKESIASFTDLKAPFRHTSNTRIAEAQTLANIGSLNRQQGNLVKATKQFESALKVLESDDRHDLENPELRSAYFKINGNYVSVLQQLDTKRAATELRRSISNLRSANDALLNLDFQRSQELSNSRPARNHAVQSTHYTNLVHENERHIADMQNNLAVVLIRQQKYEQAKKFVVQVIDYWEATDIKSPLSFSTAERLATAYNNLGEIHYRSDELDRGKPSFEKAQKILGDVVKLSPNRPETISRLGGVFHNLSLVAARNDRLEKARKLIEQAIKHQTKATQMAPTSTRFAELLRSHQKTSSAFSN